MENRTQKLQSNLLNFFGANTKSNPQKGNQTSHNNKRSNPSLNYKKKSRMTLFEDQDPEYEFEEEQKPRHITEKQRNITPLEQILGWRNDMVLPHASKSESEIQAQSKQIGTNDLLNIDWPNISQNSEIEGMLINWEWNERSSSLPADEESALYEQFDDFSSKFSIPESAMNNGICWVITPKKLISKMIEFMAKQNFGYVENMVVCQLQNPTPEILSKVHEKRNIKKKDLKDTDLEDDNECSGKENFTNAGLGKRSQPSISSFFGQAPISTKQPFGSVVSGPTQSQTLTGSEEVKFESNSNKASKKKSPKIPKTNLFLANGKCNFASISNLKVEDVMLNNITGFFYNTKLTVLMFRRLHKKLSLELRHQRNPDCFFDVHFDGFKNGLDDFGKERIYKTIETLLPKANSTDPENLKLLEINGSKPRPGWITVYKTRD